MIEFNREKCAGCGVCPKVCPHGVIVMSGAINVIKGTGCLFAIIKEDILKIKDKRCGFRLKCCSKNP